MSDWTHGYVAEIDYTYGYYPELNPLRIAVPFLNLGLAPPPIATACEIGFGQGISVNIHAAASSVRWYGTDFNPTHAGFAQSLAAAHRSGAQLFDQSFAEFCSRADLPDFDFIAVHGVWSWISDENRQVIVDFLRRKLKVGGVVYVSYNTQPGVAAMVPLRHLLTEHAAQMAAPGTGIAARVGGALDFAERLMAVNPLFALAYPAIVERLKAIKGHNRNYLAHEYFNRDWRAMAFAEMAEILGQAKLSYACSAHYLDHVDALNLTPEQQRLLDELPDPMFRQSVRDFVVNQQFRRDYWVKGVRRLSPLEQAEALRRCRVILTIGDRSQFAFTMTGAMGPREISEVVYNQLLDVLEDRRAKTIAEIEQALSGAGLRLATIYEAVMLLAGRGDLAFVQDDETQAAVLASTARLNGFMLDKARSSGVLSVLASPVTGAGFTVPRFHQLFLLARRQGISDPQALAHLVWELLVSQNQRMVRDGRTLEAPEENLTELMHEVREFTEKGLPVLNALQIA